MTAGLSETRLARLHDVMAGHVARHDIPGAVTLVERRGETHVDVVGAQAFDGGPMRRDSLFRITSMTKPITAAAALLLVEQCKLRLDDPVDHFLPELADRRVLKRLDGPLDDTVPAVRQITLRDLLTFRLGLGFAFGPPDTPLQKAIGALEITGFGPPNQATPHGPDEWLRRLGTLPLMYQPGERWLYNTGSYVLSVLIARASGQSFETFLGDHIFAPLGMRDTAFFVPADKRDRLTTSYWFETGAKTLRLNDDAAQSEWNRPPAFADGGAGLISTIDDYAAFARMLLNRGRHGSARILSPPSVTLMTTDHLTDQQKASGGLILGRGQRGWGFGVSVVTGRDEIWATPGRYGWDGGYGTSWANDPAEHMVALLMTQRAEFPLFSDVYRDFWTSVYQAIGD